MNRKYALIFIIAVLTAGASYAGTENNKVAVLYNKGTQLNRNVLHFMGSEFKSLAGQYQFFAFEKVTDIKPGAYKAIIVLNTGIRTGIDPKLSDFIDSWKDKSEIILISLYKGSKDLQVKTMGSLNNPQGVDAVSAASLWHKRGITSLFRRSEDTGQMHSEWVKQVINFLKMKG